MSKLIQDEIDLETLSARIKAARERKGLTLEELSHTLWSHGFPTSQNKLWRMENKPPRRLDSELLLWLEKVLETPLLDSDRQNQVLKDDVLALIDAFIQRNASDAPPPRPSNRGLAEIYDRVKALAVDAG